MLLPIAESFLDNTALASLGGWSEGKGEDPESSDGACQNANQWYSGVAVALDKMAVTSLGNVDG